MASFLYYEADAAVAYVTIIQFVGEIQHVTSLSNIYQMFVSGQVLGPRSDREKMMPLHPTSECAMTCVAVIQNRQSQPDDQATSRKTTLSAFQRKK
ncbi:hypothetical protein AAHA92_07997 [Salvia divinorum]|uniref:Uncharacterized protein n=1 Tax=Salvia divinorum TaxID=28513 RepID=A0ABD1HLS7_SALDI